VDKKAAALAPHVGQNGAVHPDNAKEIGIHDAFDLL
jgi:hypothetical protein